MKPGRKTAQLALGMLGLLVALGVGALQRSPGYMDADYYYAGALRLADGSGFSELILWNYLDNPQGLPHPSHAYWMPLASLISVLGMKLVGATDFASARLGFIFLAMLIPLLTASLAYALSGRSSLAILSGGLAVVSGFYLPYMPTTDTFGISMTLGACWFLVIRTIQLRLPGGRGIHTHWVWLCLLGVISGLFHLARADGITWLLISLLAVWLLSNKRNTPLSAGARASYLSKLQAILRSPAVWLGVILCLFGYLLVMGPWIVRNFIEFGVPFSPGGGRALWLTGYDELFNYPPGTITAHRWWDTGLAAIFKARWWAFGINLQTLVAVQGGIVLFPLILAGLMRLHQNLLIKLGLLVWCLTLFIMTVVFPYAGARGGFFHSGAALQPLCWALAPIGLDGLVEWGGRVRSWNIRQAKGFFRAAIILMMLALSLYNVQNRVIGSNILQPVWDMSAARYERLEASLRSLGASLGEPVLVNNPPGYFVVSGRPALAIPNGESDTLIDVAVRFGARYILLEPDHPKGLDPLYNNPASNKRLELLRTMDETHIFIINPME